jgi:hypothetical protein
MIASKECPWSNRKRQQIKLSLKLWRRPRWQSALDKKMNSQVDKQNRQKRLT